jgi:hypothetical protein
VKVELQKRKAQRAPKTATGRVFSSNLTTPGVSFAAALRGGAAQQQPQARQVPGETLPHAGVKLSTQPLEINIKQVSPFGIQL